MFYVYLCNSCYLRDAYSHSIFFFSGSTRLPEHGFNLRRSFLPSSAISLLTHCSNFHSYLQNHLPKISTTLSLASVALVGTIITMNCHLYTVTAALLAVLMLLNGADGAQSHCRMAKGARHEYCALPYRLGNFQGTFRQ